MVSLFEIENGSEIQGIAAARELGDVITIV